MYNVDLSAHLAECELNYVRLCRLLPRMDAGDVREFALGGSLSVKIEVEGLGIGTVVDIEQAKGKSTQHVVLFDSGKREAVQLCKDPSAAHPKGRKFWVLEQVDMAAPSAAAVMTRTDVSRSQC